MKPRKIKTQFNFPRGTEKGEIGGWLQGKDTYLWFGASGRCEGVLSGYKLLRLAKAIVRQIESGK